MKTDALELLASLTSVVQQLPATTQGNREAVADALENLRTCGLCLADVDDPEPAGVSAAVIIRAWDIVCESLSERELEQAPHRLEMADYASSPGFADVVARHMAEFEMELTDAQAQVLADSAVEVTLNRR